MNDDVIISTVNHNWNDAGNYDNDYENNDHGDDDDSRNNSHNHNDIEVEYDDDDDDAVNGHWRLVLGGLREGVPERASLCQGEHTSIVGHS